MVSLYGDYLSMPKCLALEEMASLHLDIVEEIGKDEEAQKLYRELISVSTRYMSFRSNWLLWSREEKMEKDSARTSCHDAVIVKFNMLARFLKMKGKEARWREVLGYEENDPNFRKRIGDFACYLVFVNSLLAR